MWRGKAVRALLVDDVAGLRIPRDGDLDADAIVAIEREELRRASRRALAVSLLCLAAVVVLFWFRSTGTPFLEPGRGEQGVFTWAILLVVAYAGFRLAQYLNLRTVVRLHEEVVHHEAD
ncbi:MAG: hypothetical protein AAF604_08860 [Acidobacteriota bacterium]